MYILPLCLFINVSHFVSFLLILFNMLHMYCPLLISNSQELPVKILRMLKVFLTLNNVMIYMYISNKNPFITIHFPILVYLLHVWMTHMSQVTFLTKIRNSQHAIIPQLILPILQIQLPRALKRVYHVTYSCTYICLQSQFSSQDKNVMMY